MADTAQAAAAEDTADSREIRVFLSSTFRDFNEERKLLATQVFPELNRHARERGVELVEVDLRWGVTQEQAEDGHALGICLAEIERCRRYFIGMLGDSYGSLTPPERQLLQAAPELLEQRQWLNGKIGQASYTDLEIEQRLQQMGGNASDGRAFFYFRDPAWSNPKADAGEQGWRSDDPADRQKLELLRKRIASSGYPLVQGLASPQAIADQIKEDLWALIDRQFPEGEQPDALEKEARKHADYRRSRTGAGQYIGGKGYISQLEHWIGEGQQQILITGESGAGKSALLANWIERHGQSHPDDLLYAHHLGCTNDANALRPLLGRLIDTASQQLLDAGVITEALAVPEDWWELVAKVAETLQTLGRWCQQHGKRWIWVLDGLDRLDPDDQQALPWLPQQLPDGVQVVASALACPAREILLERGYSTLTIQPLGAEEQEQLIQRYLKRYTKELDGGLRQQILSHHLAGSPLFLKVLLEELRQCGRHDTLKDQLAFYLSSQTVDDLYERVLERLENDGSGEAVKKVMTALWASRAGLTEPELLAITDLKPLQWAPIDLALEKAFGRNGNRLVFDHDYLRIAVRDRYLPSEEQQRQAHSGLADWFGAKDEWDERKAEELPWQLQEGGRTNDLRSLLLRVSDLYELARQLDDREVINYWRAAKAEGNGELDELIAEAVQEEIEKRKKDAADQIWFVDCIADLLGEAGLYRGLLLRLRTLSLELEEATEGRDEESMLSSLALLAAAHRDMGNFNEAESLYRQCLVGREKLLGHEHPSTFTTVGNLAGVLLDRGDYEQSEDLLKRAYKASDQLLGPEHKVSLTTVGQLAVVLHAKGDYEQAESFYRRCKEAQERLMGHQDANTLNTLGNLGLLCINRGDYKNAEALLNQCLAGKELLLGAEHPYTLATLHNLALMYKHKGDYEEAESLYKRCLYALERLLGREHPETLTTVAGLAGLFYAKKDYKQAEVLFLRAYIAREKLLGPEHPETLKSAGELAVVYHAKGDYEQAENYYKLDLAASERILGPMHLDTLITVGNLGLLYANKKDYRQAEALYRRCLDARQRLLGVNHHDSIWCAYRLAEILSEQKRHAEAIPLRRQELAYCIEKNGTSDNSTLTSINELATDLLQIGEIEEAETLFSEALEVCLKVLEPSNTEIGRALGGLARTLEAAGQLEEAANFAQQALDHRFEHEGPDASFTNCERLVLARLLHKTGRTAEAQSVLKKLFTTTKDIVEPGDSGSDLLEEAKALRIDIESSKS